MKMTRAQKTALENKMLAGFCKFMFGVGILALLVLFLTTLTGVGIAVYGLFTGQADYIIGGIAIAFVVGMMTFFGTIFMIDHIDEGDN